ncbi:MAG: MetQ/NlpA family ABC transporter substrate-binding protein [Rickettsiales bacterium]|jgi:D-methionine transport system substrate-binding protein|nr:MetQ/NlpA family ABC transporter substrate-binding protein [Rickettsiales bacterium]
MFKKYIIYAFVLLLVISGVLFALFTKKGSEKLKIGVTGNPSTAILELIKPDLKKDGIDLEIIEFGDYQTPNLALVEKSIDANSYQHKPFLDAFNKQHNTDLVSVGDTFTGIMAFYSKKIKNINELREGDKIGIPNDATNEERALLLLESAGLIKLDRKNGINITVKDITSNPNGLEIQELQAAILPRVLDDLTGCIINPGYAIDSGLNPKKDGIYYETGASPYLNVIATRQELKNNKKILTFVKHFKSKKVKDFLEKDYGGHFNYAW